MLGSYFAVRCSLGGLSLTVLQTSDLVKQRYSTRFNNVPSDFDVTAPPVPNVPSLPTQYAPADDRGRGPSPGRGPGLALDPRVLRDPNLNPEQYVAGLLSDASEQDIEEFQASLRKMKTRTSTDLQQNVYQNRAQFIKISKEAEKLKGEMRALRNLMSELKTNTTALRAASSQGPSNSSTDFDQGFSPALSKRDKRSSVADRTALWNSQLQVLLLTPDTSFPFTYSNRLYGNPLKARKNSSLQLLVVTWCKMLVFG
jgi:hypothetical protein